MRSMMTMTITLMAVLAIQQTTAMPTSIINGTPMVNRIAKDLAVKSEEKQLKVDTPADVSKVAVQPVNTKPQVIPSATILPSTTTTTKEAAPTSTPLLNNTAIAVDVAATVASSKQQQKQE